MLISERTNRGRERYQCALWYVWGREDAGDRRLRDVLRGDHVAVDLFASFASDRADAYDREQVTSLPSVQDQYGRFLAIVTPGTRFTHYRTRVVYEVVSYNATTAKADMVVISDDDINMPKGFTFTLTAQQLGDTSDYGIDR